MVDGGADPVSRPTAAAARAFVLERAARLGFSAVGVTDGVLDASVRSELDAFLAEGRHGDMDWLTTRVAERAQPRALWADVVSVVMLGVNYGPDADPLMSLRQRTKATISAYAKGRDYHDVVKKKLKRLAREIVAFGGGADAVGVKVFVDTAPVAEKPLAQSAGLGWAGKHTNLVSREFGSWLFLGSIFTTLTIERDAAETDHCGACRACLDVCPTNAFPAPYQLDARACISYLTIECKGPIPRTYRKAMGNRIYGCDDCLAVCPWNKFARLSSEAKFAAGDWTDAPDLLALSRLDDAAFRIAYAGSPIKRTGRDRFIRNVMVAIGNSQDGGLAPAIFERASDASPLVRGATAWAAREILPHATFEKLKARQLAQETDATVRSEWNGPDEKGEEDDAGEAREMGEIGEIGEIGEE